MLHVHNMNHAIPLWTYRVIPCSRSLAAQVLWNGDAPYLLIRHQVDLALTRKTGAEWTFSHVSWPGNTLRLYMNSFIKISIQLREVIVSVLGILTLIIYNVLSWLHFVYISVNHTTENPMIITKSIYTSFLHNPSFVPNRKQITAVDETDWLFWCWDRDIPG